MSVIANVAQKARSSGSYARPLPKRVKRRLPPSAAKSQQNKNDRNDAEAIATAARQGNMRFVAVKRADQQARLAWHRVREGLKSESLALSNRMRGLLAEFGIVLPQSQAALRSPGIEVPRLKVINRIKRRGSLHMNTIPVTIGVDLAKSSFSYCKQDDRGRVLEQGDLRRQAFMHWLGQLPAGTVVAMEACSGAHHWARRCQAYGLVPRLMAAQFAKPFRQRWLNDAEARAELPLMASDALVASVGRGQDFNNGRQMAAWLGLTPTQHSTGGKARLGHLARRGDGYLRTLLMQGARSCVLRAKAVSPDKATPEDRWIQQLAARMPFTKLLAAIANKHARQLWVMLARDVDYDPCAAMQHPLGAKAALSNQQLTA